MPDELDEPGRLVVVDLAEPILCDVEGLGLKEARQVPDLGFRYLIALLYFPEYPVLGNKSTDVRPWRPVLKRIANKTRHSLTGTGLQAINS